MWVQVEHGRLVLDPLALLEDDVRKPRTSGLDQFDVEVREFFDRLRELLPKLKSNEELYLDVQAVLDRVGQLHYPLHKFLAISGTPRGKTRLIKHDCQTTGGGDTGEKEKIGKGKIGVPEGTHPRLTPQE